MSTSARMIVRILLGIALLLASLSSVGCSDTLGRAREAEADGDFQTAVRLFEEYLKERPDDLEALNGVAVLLYLGGDFDGALPYQERVVALDPTDFQTRVELGFNYLNHQNAPLKAVAAMTEAVSLEPTAKHLTFLAQAQFVSGDAAAAEKSLRRAIAIDRQYVHAYKVLIQILEQEGRVAETIELREAAAAAGVVLGR